ncbi:TonB-dependent receptor plug domain-containing protein [Actimicrobium antarcticum]|uniref:TonB-dependent receptor n=1 Tax=Actimicrobium antarcticum TaxID=1051899 RepID=A0ABP7TZ20_9BURK
MALALIAGFSLPVRAHDQQLEPVVVTSKRPTAKTILREDVVTTETISARDIEKSGATTLTEALDKRPGIAMQTECSICNVRNVVLNNLPGRYTTVMIDGIPIFSSVSSAYGLDSVSLGGIERIDIARGAGASLIAPEALSGSVNIVTRRPMTNELQYTQQIGSYGQLQSAWFGARVFTGGAVTANVSRNQHNTVDGDGNDISEYSGYRRNLGGLGFFADDLGGFKVRGRLDVVSEKRNGGALGRDAAGIKGDGAGNPFDWSKGAHGSPDSRGWVTPDGAGPDTLSNGQSGTVYNDGRAGMSEIIFTDRTQFIASGVKRLGEGSMRLAFGYAKHRQDSFYEKSTYIADQRQTYVELSTQQPLGETLVTGGFNYRYENLNSKGQSSDGMRNDGIDNYVYRTPGVFLQAYHSLFDGKLEANGSVRIDKHNVFGTITSPRLNLLWNHDEHLNSRIAVGKGFRAPTSFFEQDHGILDTTRVDRQISKPEVSHNASYTLAYAADRLSWVGSVNWNRIHDMALLDPNQTDPVTGQSVTRFTSADNPVTLLGGDVTATYKITSALEGTLGLERTRYSFDPGTLAFARPDKRVYLRLDYASGPWDVFSRATWTGSQDLARFYDYANNPRYNLDGTPKRDRSPSFWVVDLRGEYRVNKRWSAFVGLDNLFDFKQSDKESFLWVDRGGALDVTHIWGPNRGRFVYAGVKFAL